MGKKDKDGQRERKKERERDIESKKEKGCRKLGREKERLKERDTYYRGKNMLPFINGVQQR